MKFTKILSLLLAAVLFLSSFGGFALPAAAATPTLTLGQTIAFTLESQETAQYAFTVPETGWYAFTMGEDHNVWDWSYWMEDTTHLPERTYSDYDCWKGGWMEKDQVCILEVNNWYTTANSYQLSAKKLSGPEGFTVEFSGAELAEREERYVGSYGWLDITSVPEGYEEDYTVTSDNTEVVSCNDTRLSFLAEGTANITVTSESGSSRVITMDVIPVPTYEMGQELSGTVRANREVRYQFTAPSEGWYAFRFAGVSQSCYTSLETESYSSGSYALDGWKGKWLSAGETCQIVLRSYADQDEAYTLTAKTLSGPTELIIRIGSTPIEGKVSEYVGENLYVNATFLPKGYEESVSYVSSDEQVLGMGWSSGSMECLAEGSATVTATSQSGLTASFQVDVVEIPYISITAELGVKLIENQSGEGWDNGDGYEFNYTVPGNLLTITLTRKDGGKEEYSMAELEDTGYSVYVNTDQYNEPWSVGINYATIEYLGLSAQFPVEVIANPGTDATDTQMQQLSQELQWKKAEGYPNYYSFSNIVGTDDWILAAGNVLTDADNWVSEGVLAYTQDSVKWEQKTLVSILQGLGLAESGEVCKVQSIKEMDGVTYISYLTENQAGTLTTEDGQNYASFPFPYQIYESNVWYTEEKELCSQQVYKSGDTYIVICGNAFYYTSQDLQTWTKRSYPSDWQWRHQAKPFDEDTIGNYVEFDVAAVTDHGIYFKAWYNFGPTSDYDTEGIFFTGDFVNYTNITKDQPDGGIYTTQPMNNPLGNDRVAIIAGWSEYCYVDYYHMIKLLIYNEETGELKETVCSENVVPYYTYNLAGLDPVHLTLKENGNAITYYVDSESGELLAKHNMGIDLTTWESSLKIRSTVEEKSYYLDIGIYGDQLIFSEDYFETAYYTTLPAEVNSIHVGRVQPDFEEGTLTLYGSQCYYASLEPITNQLNGMAALEEKTTGVQVLPASPDALQSNVQLQVEQVSASEEKIIYNISLTDGNTEVQPDLAVYVRIPVPAVDEGCTFRVYRVEADGSRTDMNAELENGYLVFLTDHFSTYEVHISGMVWVNPFTDITESNRFFPAVKWAVKNQITSGKTDTTFAPNLSVTRGQFIMFLWRLAGKPEPTITESPFPDVQGNNSFRKAVLWAVENGITAGQKDGNFGLNEPCTRGHVVMFLYRYAYMGKEKPTFENVDAAFSDVSKNNTYFNAVMWAVSEGITGGNSDGTFGRSTSCKRIHAVTFLHRYASSL